MSVARDAGQKRRLKTAALGCITYLAISVFAFGSLLKPVLLATIWSDRLGAPHWFWIVSACFAVAAFSFFIPARFSLVRGPIFVAMGMVGSLLTVGAYADNLRSTALIEFGADRQTQHSFLDSVRHAPEEFQFFLHATVMKHCVPYAWSYRTMSFYRVPLRAAVNVMPTRWLTECSIHRE